MAHGSTMMRSATLRAPAAKPAKTAVAINSKACAVLRPSASARNSPGQLTCSPTLKLPLRRGAAAAGQGDALLSGNTFATTTSATTTSTLSAEGDSSSTLTAPNPAKPPHLSAAYGSASKPAAKMAATEAEAAGDAIAHNFDWKKQWYPVARPSQLDPSKPTATQLLGLDLVLWRDQQGQWRAFRDACPHRLAPLSQGRIDDVTGNLYCNYHGGSSGCSASDPEPSTCTATTSFLQPADGPRRPQHYMALRHAADCICESASACQ
eukprot:GHRQ01001813.1.p1 GENE.GHRQ01001813.1~~GHRQ01001813.1.p1  ORF type:complete len:265 (+),score=67.45 GHRQ01001813.1:363-1157(+)